MKKLATLVKGWLSQAGGGVILDDWIKMNVVDTRVGDWEILNGRIAVNTCKFQFNVRRALTSIPAVT